jgi:small-conductance mechanosensitive channel
MEAAERHGLVLKDPAPQVLFQDFGDNALAFELRYWVDVQKSNSAQVASDLRHIIAVAFAQNGISISFPQRDVHFDTARPLQIEVIHPPGHAPAEPPSDASSKPAS